MNSDPPAEELCIGAEEQYFLWTGYYFIGDGSIANGVALHGETGATDCKAVCWATGTLVEVFPSFWAFQSFHRSDVDA